MTALDDRLYEILDELADGRDTVQIAGRELAAILGDTERHVRDSQRRLARDGLITITKSSPNHPSIITLLGYPDETVGGVDRGVTLTTPTPVLVTETARAQRPPTSAPPAGGDATPTRTPDPGCPVCLGTGWTALPEPANTVEVCRCLGSDYRSWWFAKRRATASAWPATTFTEHERPARADYTAVMLEWNRRQLAAAQEHRHIDEPVPEPSHHLTLVEDGDPAF